MIMANFLGDLMIEIRCWMKAFHVTCTSIIVSQNALFKYYFIPIWLLELASSIPLFDLNTKIHKQKKNELNYAKHSCLSSHLFCLPSIINIFPYVYTYCVPCSYFILIWRILLLYDSFNRLKMLIHG